MPEWTDQFTFTIPIIQFTMDPEDHAEDDRQQPLTKKISMLTPVSPVQIETPDSGRKMSDPSKYYIPPQCNNRLSPRSARKRDSRRRNSKTGKDDSQKEGLGPRPCNCESCRTTSPLPPGYGLQTLSPGYDQIKSSLLEVPWSEDYTEASSDDLSSEWDSDVPESPRPVQKVMKLFDAANYFEYV
jgi:hypothetical protein